MIANEEGIPYCGGVGVLKAKGTKEKKGQREPDEISRK